MMFLSALQPGQVSLSPHSHRNINMHPFYQIYKAADMPHCVQSDSHSLWKWVHVQKLKFHCHNYPRMDVRLTNKGLLCTAAAIFSICSTNSSCVPVSHHSGVSSSLLNVKKMINLQRSYWKKRSNGLNVNKKHENIHPSMFLTAYPIQGCGVGAVEPFKNNNRIIEIGNNNHLRYYFFNEKFVMGNCFILSKSLFVLL